MEYPGARFTRPIRLATLIVFITAFVVMTPIILLYAAGYHYDWQNGLLRETGGLSIDIVPTTAVVYLDSLPLTESLPIRLKNIAPKNYNVEIDAPGYYTWEKNVTVSPQQTRYIKDITLIKKSEPVKIADGTVHTLSLSPDNRYFIYSLDDGANHVFKLVDEKNKRTSTIATINASGLLKVTWDNNDAFAITSPEAPYTTFFVGHATNPDTTARLPNLTTEPITKFIWKDTDSDSLLYLGTSSSIFSFSPTLNRKQTIATNTFADWYVADNVLWTLTTTTDTAIITKDALGFKTAFASITTSTSGIAPENFSPSNWHIATIHDDQVLLQENSYPKMLIVRADKQFALNTDNFYISPYNNWWLLRNPSELWAYSEDGEPGIVMRTGDLLQDVVPLDPTNVLGLEFNHSIDVLFPYEYVEQTLVPENTSALAADPTRRVLYYTTADGLFSLAY